MKTTHRLDTSHRRGVLRHGAVAACALLMLAGCQKEAPTVAANAPAAGEATEGAGKKTAKEPAQEPAMKRPIIDHEVETLAGEKVSLSAYRGKALLIVNTASQCGFTPQYADLQKLYERFKPRGLEVLAFPSNDFGGQEPGTAAEIRTFVDEKFEVTFPMFAKVHAKGDAKSPLYRTLTEASGDDLAGEVRWNFTKFLVDPAGRPVARFGSMTSPLDDDVIAAVERVLPDAKATP